MGQNNSTTPERARDDIARIIAALLRKTTDRGATPEEAAAAAAKAQELVYKYQVELAEYAEVDGEASPTREGFTVVDFGLGVVFGQMTDWRRLLLAHICSANFCRAVQHTGRNWRQSYGKAGNSAEEVMTVVGQPHNLEVVRWMYDYLCETLEYAVKTRWAELRAPAKGSISDDERIARAAAKRTHPLRWKDSFLKGAVQTIGYRLRYEKQRFAQTSTALVLASDTAVEDALRSHFGRLGTAPRSEFGSGNAYRQGQQAGRNISLNTPVRGGNGTEALP
jgi:hypothetical protein